jgi:hypothetical protein
MVPSNKELQWQIKSNSKPNFKKMEYKSFQSSTKPFLSQLDVATKIKIAIADRGGDH